jgi:tRNA A-37 threonylcarbamoyl transferase component Bud32
VAPVSERLIGIRDRRPGTGTGGSGRPGYVWAQTLNFLSELVFRPARADSGQNPCPFLGEFLKLSRPPARRQANPDERPANVDNPNLVHARAKVPGYRTLGALVIIPLSQSLTFSLSVTQIHMPPTRPQPAARGRRELPAALRHALTRMGLLAPGQPLSGTPLPGGVSSDIWRVDLPSGPVCVKRALAKLKVDADWRVPVERNRYEAAWLRTADSIVAGAAPAVLGEDPASRAFAMAYLEPDRYPQWKKQLITGEVSADFAREVGNVLGRIHAASADRDDFASAFRTDENFYAIRLEPYLIAAAENHPDVAGVLRRLAKETSKVRKVLVHGDVSPKNILVGPSGPVFLDAECAWFGDAAFDLAFCLNHLLLKGMVIATKREALKRAFEALRAGYLSAVHWESAEALEARTARLLPGLTLARVDGKSPVEYLQRESDRGRVRAAAKGLLARPADGLIEASTRWWQALEP